MNKTSISWTNLTSNPVYVTNSANKRGWLCTKVSQGCTHCYSETLNMRYGNKLFYNSISLKDVVWHLNNKEIAAWKLLKVPMKIFVCDMTDIFHERIPQNFVTQILDGMNLAPEQIFQILTKRPSRITEFRNNIPPNAWVGVSVEHNEYVNRIESLRRNYAGMKFISFEPLIGDIGKVDLTMISWIIIGGESGTHHRPMNIEWARNLVRQAKEQGVAVWMKQLGGIRPGGNLEDFPEDLRIREFPAPLIKPKKIKPKLPRRF